MAGRLGKHMSSLSAAKFVKFFQTHLFADNTDITGKVMGVYQHTSGGTIKDIIFTQIAAGANGTSVTCTVKINGTTVCTTDGIIVVGAGARKSVDALAEITAVSNCTRPVLDTAAITLAKGDVLTVDYTTTGTYSSTFPEVACTVVVEPTK